MKKLTEMTLGELQQVIADAQKEIATREAAGNGFDAEFRLSGKAYRPATYKQYQFADSLADKTGSVIDTTPSQIMKRMEMEEMVEAIDLMKDGKRIRIY